MKFFTTSNKQNVIIDQVNSMRSLTYVGEKKYSLETIARAFEYFPFQGHDTLDLEMITSFQA